MKNDPATRLVTEREALLRTAASLAAAISLLERGGNRTAAASDRMFDQMIADYKRTLKVARSVLRAGDSA